MKKTLGKLHQIDPRTVWENEARDFTPWVRDNLDLLAEAVGLDLELVETESRVGNYAVDVYAKDLATDRWVIIENQLAQTDHGHLGQLMAYAAGKEAGVVIWISPVFRDEHRQTLDWLNEIAGEKVSFFGIQIELLQVDDSLPAPNLKIVAQPNEWVRAVEQTVVSPRQQAYEAFFDVLLEKVRSKYPDLTKAKHAFPQNWFGFPVGRSGFTINAVFGDKKTFRVELYIDTSDRDRNKAAFDALYQDRQAIETEVGQIVTWDRLDDRRASRVHCSISGSIGDAQEKLEELQEWALELVWKFHEAFHSRVQKLKI